MPQAAQVSLAGNFRRAIFLCSGAVLLIAASAFFVYDLYSFREQRLQQLHTLGEAIASNSTAALAFANPDDAALVLSALRADQSVRAAVLFDAADEPFAVYPQGLDLELLPVPHRDETYGFRGLRAVGFQPVIERSRRLGTLYVESDLRAIFDRARLYALIVLLVACFAGLSAYLISRRLQQRLMQPIGALTEAAAAVSERHNYAVRATRSGIVEFDTLTDAFNHMLMRIQQSEDRLHAQLGHLGLLQHITRATGDRQDMTSILDVVLGSLESNFVDFACVLLHDRDARTLAVERIGPGSRGIAGRIGLAEGQQLPVDPNGLTRCLQGQLVYEPDVRGVEFALPRQLAAGNQRSVVLAPLMFESDVHGVLVCARCVAESFSSSECEFLKQLAEHVALAGRQATLYGALQQAYDDLRQSQLTLLQQERLRALGQMASGIAHDINNAISPVALYTESLLEREPGLSERARGYLTTIQQAVEDVARTVSRMREFYRERDGQHAQERVDLNSAVRQVIDLTRPRWSDQAQQRGAAVEMRMLLADGLPQISGAVNEIRDALTNLVFNAVDAMPEGGALTIETRMMAGEAAAGAVVLEVSDTGIGMDEDTRRKCLEPFYTTKGERGTGLGLAMVYGMVQRHGATLEIDSSPGSGSIFRLCFAAAPISQVAPAPTAVALRPQRPLRVLVVDDDPMLLKSLRETLQHDGHAITAAAGGQAGIDAFSAALRRGEAIDLVITDLGMPYIDGRKVAAAIKALSPATPVLMLTGWGQRMLASNELPPGVDRVLGKPPRLQEMRATIAELVP